MRLGEPSGRVTKIYFRLFTVSTLFSASFQILRATSYLIPALIPNKVRNQGPILNVAVLLVWPCEITLMLHRPAGRPLGRRNVTWVKSKLVSSCMSIGVMSCDPLPLSTRLIVVCAPADKFVTNITTLVFGSAAGLIRFPGLTTRNGSLNQSTESKTAA